MYGETDNPGNGRELEGNLTVTCKVPRGGTS